MEKVSAEFVGRETELGALDAAFSQATRFKAPQMVTIIGALGSGKRRLIDEWLDSKRTLDLRVDRKSVV